MLTWIRRTLTAFLWLMARNSLTVFGASLTTFSFLAIAAFFGLEFSGLPFSPYVGIIQFLVLPAAFVFGLLVIPVGLVWQYRHDRRHGREWRREEMEEWPKIDLNNPRVRQIGAMVLFLSMVNLFVVGATSYQGVVYMDSVEFCAEVCHSVMEPEFAAYQNSPHSRVACVECHIGPGAPWFVRAKLSGIRQVFAVTFNTYDRPIPTPVENLRPSRDICEECHWPEKFTGDRVKIIRKFAEDETNTPAYTVLLMHIGGGSSDSHGIHSWHIDPRRETSYISLDPQRQEIALVRVKEPDGTVTEYYADGVPLTAEQIATAEMRQMDCMDCHNRPTHTFELPAAAVDKAISHGEIDATLPFVKKVSVEALKESKGERGDLEQIERRFTSFYQQHFGDSYRVHAEKVASAIRSVQRIYSRNVFPEMGVTWGTYPNNISHIDSPGCFRCHDDSHKSKDGKVISQDCTLCHGVLAMEEESPSILAELGIQ